MHATLRRMMNAGKPAQRNRKEKVIAEKAQQKEATRTRSFAITLSNELTQEIRDVAAEVGLPVGTVRDIVTEDATKALGSQLGSVRKTVGAHFYRLFEGE